jgi:hypothetical protein
MVAMGVIKKTPLNTMRKILLRLNLSTPTQDAMETANPRKVQEALKSKPTKMSRATILPHSKQLLLSNLFLCPSKLTSQSSSPTIQGLSRALPVALILTMLFSWLVTELIKARTTGLLRTPGESPGVKRGMSDSVET